MPIRRHQGLLHNVDLAVLTLLCIILGALIPFLLSFGFNVSTPRMYARMLVSTGIASINLGAIALGFIGVVCCYVIIRALVAVRYREGPLHYIEIGVRMLFCAPLGALITFPISFQYNIPTPGLYAAMKLVPDTGSGAEWLAPLIPRLIVAGFVNVFFGYVIVRVLAAIVAGLHGKKDPAARGGQELN